MQITWSALPRPGAENYLSPWRSHQCAYLRVPSGQRNIEQRPPW